MKKKFLFICLLLLSFNLKIYASDYTIENYKIDSYIENDGSLLVKEYIILNGNFNGFYRDIEYSLINDEKFNGEYNDFRSSDIYDSSAFLDLKVYDFNVDNYELIKEFENKSGSNGSYGVYEIKKDMRTFEVKIYNHSKNDKKGFYIEYKLKDAVVVHNDIAELLWSFVGRKFKDDIKNLEINVYLPSKTSDLRVWAHGPLNGTIFPYSNNRAEFKVSNLKKNSIVNLRLMFDKKIVNNAKKFSNVDGKDKILELEGDLADEANKLRFIKLLIRRLSILFFIIVLIFYIYTYFKYDKEFEPEFKNKYYREIPDFINYDEMSCFYKGDFLKKEAICATILEIIRKKGFVFSKEKGLFKDKIILISNQERESLTDLEKFIKEVFIDAFEKNGKIVLGGFSSKILNNSKNSAFQINITKWWKKLNSKIKNLYLDYKKFKNISVIFITIFGVLGFCFSVLYDDAIIGMIHMFILIVTFVYFNMLKKRKKESNENYYKIKAFKNFLNDFGRMDEKEIPQIALWDKYLVYATALGCAASVEKAMKIKLSNMNFDSNIYPNLVLLSIISNNTNLNFAGVISDSISSLYNSSVSSGSGYGGGASSGAGFSGGGGGGGF